MTETVTATGSHYGQLLQEDLAQQRPSLYFAVAALTWLAWDTLIHLDVEIQHVWSHHITWANAAYLFSRYVTIIHLGLMIGIIHMTGVIVPGQQDVSPSLELLCVVAQAWEASFPVLLNFIVELVLTTRLRALYHNNRAVLITIYVAWTLEQVVTVAAAGFSFLIGGKNFFGCTLTTGPFISLPYWIAPIVFQTFLFALTIAALRHRIKSQFIGHSLLDLFIRDGMWAYSSIFAAQLANLLANVLAPSNLFYEASPGVFLPDDLPAGSETLTNVPAIIGYCWALAVSPSRMYCSI